MYTEQRIEHLIKTASALLDNDINRDTRRQFAEQAVDCLTALVGSDHPYTNMLREVSIKGEKTTESIVSGVLWATKLQLDKELHPSCNSCGAASSWRELSGNLS
jgi:hypothetical protein